MNTPPLLRPDVGPTAREGLPWGILRPGPLQVPGVGLQAPVGGPVAVWLRARTETTMNAVMKPALVLRNGEPVT